MTGGAGGAELLGDLTLMIQRAAATAPRSLQTDVGPSQLGVPCDRQLFALVNSETVLSPGDDIVPVSDPVPSMVGTAVHRWLDSAAGMDNSIRSALGEHPRWLAEQRVTAQHRQLGVSVSGTCDLFDMAARAVIDWKVVGPTSLKAVKAFGPSAAYQTQVQLYGLGFVDTFGVAPETVNIAFLPRNGPLTGLHLWSERFDPAQGLLALERYHRVRAGSWEDAAPSPDASVCRWCPLGMNACPEGMLFRA